MCESRLFIIHPPVGRNQYTFLTVSFGTFSWLDSQLTCVTCIHVRVTAEVLKHDGLGSFTELSLGTYPERKLTRAAAAHYTWAQEPGVKTSRLTLCLLTCPRKFRPLQSGLQCMIAVETNTQDRLLCG